MDSGLPPLRSVPGMTPEGDWLSVARLALTFACCRYDRMEAIREGEVVLEGIDLNCIAFRSGRQIFDRMVGGQEFDVAELSASEFISLMGRGYCPFVALPVFPSRVFRHGYIFMNTRRGIRAPKDLEGKRVGVPLYTQTAAIWVRGLLARQFGVDLASIQWVEGQWRRSEPTAGRMRPRCCGRSPSSATAAASRSVHCSRAEPSMP
jgi:4,5-dihydroxyphthalate decarboxylase